jgi:archaellum component FlaC
MKDKICNVCQKTIADLKAEINRLEKEVKHWKEIAYEQLSER